MTTYDLHRLGWHSFQKLCLTITREILGQTVQAFLPSKDAGRDGAFAGKWNPQGTEELSGRFIIQCKYTSKADRVLRLTDLADELPKAQKLVQRRHCDVYILLTNFGLSGIQDEKIEPEFLAVGVKRFLCFGADWICQQIQSSRRLRALVPRVYGLGDLSQILDERAYAQARALLESMREDLSRVVLTSAYDRAIKALYDHGFVLLLGEPACGKTTVAAMLAMAAIDQWKVSTLKLETSQQMIDHWNPQDPAQFFWIDDAFGVTQFESPLALDWNRILPKIVAMIKAGARVVLTSRDYIYKRAKQVLKESAFPLMHESQVVIDVQDISKDERKQILYNHIKLGTQSKEFRSTLKPFLDGVACHPRFNPETARRLGNPLFTRGLAVNLEDLNHFVERQERLLQEVIQGIDKHSQAALSLIFMRNGALESPVRLRESELTALVRLGSHLGETVTALGALRDSLTVLVVEDSRALWRFKHPTVGDAYGLILLSNPELMDVYIEGASPEKLLQTITCGDVGLKGAVVISRTLYEPVAAKLWSFQTASATQGGLALWQQQSKIDGFLAQRCDRKFLELYLLHNPGLLDRVSSPGLYLSAVSEVKLAVRLRELGLLPEKNRKKFVETVTQYTVEGQDSYVFQSEAIRQMFSPQENDEMLSRLRTELVPNLGKARRDWEMNHSATEDPKSYIEPFIEILSGLEKEFEGDDAITEAVSIERDCVDEWVLETLSDIAEQQERGDLGDQEYDETDYEYPSSSAPVVQRSVFDDIDE